MGLPPPLCGLHYHLCVGNFHLRVASSLPTYCGSFCCCALRAVPSRFVGLTDPVRGFPFLPVGSFTACGVAGRFMGLTDLVRGFPFLPVGLFYRLRCCRSSRLRLWSCLSWHTSGSDLPCLRAVLLWPKVVTFLPPSGANSCHVWWCSHYHYQSLQSDGHRFMQGKSLLFWPRELLLWVLIFLSYLNVYWVSVIEESGYLLIVYWLWFGCVLVMDWLCFGCIGYVLAGF